MRQEAMGTPDMIGIDWGTSSFRAFLMGSNGQEFDQFSSADGLLAVRDRAFGAVLQKTCGAWLAHWPDLKVIMCGMVGSQSGWRDAGYLDGNARVQDLAAALVPVQTDTHGVDIRLVPGIKGQDFAGRPDVMRGEETILMGALSQGMPATSVVCQPGTHPKWVPVQEGNISRFATFMTGELFAMLCNHSILTPLIIEASTNCDDAFREGLAMASSTSDVAHQLFSLRAGVLTGADKAETLADRLSGLLIGSELNAVAAQGLLDQPVTLISDGALASRYELALINAGVSFSKRSAEACCKQGLAEVFARA